MGVHFLTMSHGVQKPGVIGWMNTATEKRVRGTSVVAPLVSNLKAVADTGSTAEIG